MEYGPIVPTIKVASMKASLAFYTDVLGFAVKWSWSNEARFEETNQPEFACIECGAAVLFLSESSGGSESSLFVEMPFVENVDALAEGLKGRVEMKEVPTSRAWGSREFSLKDPDGHTLRFSCPLDRTNRN